MTEIFIVNLVSLLPRMLQVVIRLPCLSSFFCLFLFLISWKVEKLGVGSVAWQLSMSGSLGHMEGMLPHQLSLPVGANWENIITDHGRYWIWDVVKLSVIKFTENDRAWGFKSAVGGGHYEGVTCQSLEEVLRPWLTFFFSAGEEISHTQAERGLKEIWHVFPVWLGLSSPFTKVKIPQANVGNAMQPRKTFQKPMLVNSFNTYSTYLECFWPYALWENAT